MEKIGTSPLVMIIAALISAVGAIIVAYIGIVPSLKEDTVPAQSDVCSISGEITLKDNSPLKNAEVYLIRATGDERMATTDDKGKFTFQKIPDMSYWVLVRNTDGQASRTLIEEKDVSGDIEVEQVESLLHYERCKE